MTLFLVHRWHIIRSQHHTRLTGVPNKVAQKYKFETTTEKNKHFFGSHVWKINKNINGMFDVYVFVCVPVRVIVCMFLKLQVHCVIEKQYMPEHFLCLIYEIKHAWRDAK